MKIYKKSFGFLRNTTVTEEILSLDPVKDHCRIVHLFTGYEFPWDVIRALEIALMKSFCSPRISGLLHRTGEFRKHGQKRYDDTALLVAEFMQNGYDSEKGQSAITHTNKIHGLYKIENDDFLFVLSTFIFMPINWIENYGWRKITDIEKQALFHFFKAVGERMHIQNIPASLKEFATWVKAYEEQHVIPIETNTQVGNVTINIVKGWMPSIAKPLVFPAIKCLLDDDMLKALNYSRPSSVLKNFVKYAMHSRAFFLKKITFKKYPSFVTIEKNRTYPYGYAIEQLGPENLVKKL